MVDALWGDREGRRSIRLGKWMLSCTLPLEEDILLNYHQHHYSSEINQILSPHIAFLHKITVAPGKVSSEESPALEYLRAGNAISGGKVELTKSRMA